MTLVFAIALIVLIPIALLGHRIGDLLPMLAFFAVAAFDVFAVPSVPGSPIACMDHRSNPCAGHQAAVIGWCFVAPLAAAVVIKMLRGDKRGVTGTWRR
jgi:hypothetical protein